MDIIRAVEADYMKEDLEPIQVGDFVRVHFKVKEGSRERIQIFDGSVIAIKGKGLGQSFTVRKISYGVGVERVFPRHSPKIEKVEVVRHGKVRRAKLYYLRDRQGKAAKVKGAYTVGITGEDGGNLKEIVDFIIRIPSKQPTQIENTMAEINSILCKALE